MKRILIATGAVSLVLGTAAADWPQYHGATLDNRSTEKIAESWPSDGLKEVWRVDLNTGFSSFVVADGRVFTLERRPVDTVDHEGIVALNAATGEELWFKPLCVAKYRGGGDSGAANNKGGDGPRSTPSIDGNRVYAYSSQMKLFCFDAENGTELWSVDILKDYDGKNITWESAASPLIEGDLVYVYGGGPGQALLAFNKETGELAWRTQDDGMTHSTPTPATIDGIRQIIFFTQSGLVGVEAPTGNVLWRQEYPYKASRGMSPVVDGNLVYASQGYGIGAGAYRIQRNGDEWKVEEVWRTPNKQLNHWSTPVEYEGYVYGVFNHNQHATAPLKCVNIETGEVAWEQEGFGMGSVILVNDRLLALTDYGDLVMVKATPEGYKELNRAKVLDGKCWSTPALSDGRLFVRSTSEGACFNLTE